MGMLDDLFPPGGTPRGTSKRAKRHAKQLGQSHTTDLLGRKHFLSQKARKEDILQRRKESEKRLAKRSASNRKYSRKRAGKLIKKVWGSW